MFALCAYFIQMERSNIIDYLKKENETLKQQLTAQKRHLIEALQNENRELRETCFEQKKLLEQFLNEDQITMINSIMKDPEKKIPVREWCPDSIIKGEKEIIKIE